MENNSHWVGTWASSPAPSDNGVGFSNVTLRMNPRVSIGGDTIRVRLSNACGSGNLEIGSAYVGIRDTGSAIVPGSARKLTFGGEPSATVAAGSLLISDAVELDVEPLADLAVSFYLPGAVPADFQINGRYARQINYISPVGDFTDTVEMPVGTITDEWYFISGIDVLKRLAEDEATKDIPALALSAAATHRDIESGLDAGFRHYLTKPVDINKLVDAVRDVLDLS